MVERRELAVTESGLWENKEVTLAQFVGYINNWILGELGDFWFVLFANFYDVNRPTMVDFKPLIYHWNVELD